MGRSMGYAWVSLQYTSEKAAEFAETGSNCIAMYSCTLGHLCIADGQGLSVFGRVVVGVGVIDIINKIRISVIRETMVHA